MQAKAANQTIDPSSSVPSPSAPVTANDHVTMASPPSFTHEIGPDGIARESPAILYAEKVIEEEQLQLKRYIQENYSKIRDVERELESLTLELKLTAGPKKAALEHLRKKIELSTEKIRVAKLKEDQAKKVWEAAAQAVKDEEAIKQKLCEDLNQLVQESTTRQLSRLEELKRRLGALNPSRVSSDISKPLQEIQSNATAVQATPHSALDSTARIPESTSNPGNGSSEVPSEGNYQQRGAEVREKKRNLHLGRGKGNNIVPKGRGPLGPGWTGAGFDVDGRT